MLRMVDKRIHILSYLIPVEIASIILKFAKERKRKHIKNTTEIKIKHPKEKHLMKYYHHHNQNTQFNSRCYSGR